jgi:acyl-CoA reductase-like NAD-dependent aldehyde dehydrogenase
LPLKKISDEILARKDELGRLLSREEGKTLPEGIGEVVRALRRVSGHGPARAQCQFCRLPGRKPSRGNRDRIICARCTNSGK